VQPLGIDGAWVVTPRILRDSRGCFLGWFRGEEVAAALGYRLDVAQVNCSVSGRGVIRGVHFADVPLGQAKYVCCVRGAILDVVVDIRVGSPSYGRWEAVQLDDQERRAVFLARGSGMPSPRSAPRRPSSTCAPLPTPPAASTASIRWTPRSALSGRTAASPYCWTRTLLPRH
jgi:dTDP-4-dehydrorhamnose 3,5-epimerase